MNRQEITDVIVNNVYANSQGLITGPILQQVLINMLDYIDLSQGTGYWEMDEDGNVYTPFNAYSLGELSAYGQGPEGGGGGGGSYVSWGPPSDGYSPLTVEGESKTVALSGHKHLWEDITNRPDVYTKSEIDAMLGSQFWQLDEDGNLYTTRNVYSHGEMSAYGQGPEGGGGGGGSYVVWGAETAQSVYLSVEGVSKELALKSGVDEAIANIAIPFANLINKPTTISGYGITDAVTISQFNNHINDNVRHITTPERANWNTAYGWGSHAGLYTSRATIGGNYSSIRSLDSRNTNEVPNTDRANGMWLDFKLSSVIGLFNTGIYAGVLTVLPYLDSSGNNVAGGRIALSNGNLYIQRAQSNSYEAWKKIHTSADFSPTDYVKKSGDTMTGPLTAPSFKLPNGWTFEPAGTELHFKYNGLLRSRMLSNGSFVAMSEVTAYGSASGGSNEPLNLSIESIRNEGDTYNHRFEFGRSNYNKVDFYEYGGIFNLYRGRATQALSTLLVTLGENNTFLNPINVPKIEMGNGWTIEQTNASMTIRKNGVIKGTFNA